MPDRAPLVRVWDAALSGRKLAVLLEDGNVIEEDANAVVLVPEGWWSLGLLSVGDVVVTATEAEAVCCLDGLRRLERGAHTTVVGVATL